MRLFFCSVAASLLLVACDPPQAEVAFSEPLPFGRADEQGFSPRHQGCYVLPDDTMQQCLVRPQGVVSQRWVSLGWHRRAAIDSLRRSARAAGAAFRVLGQQGDSAHAFGLYADTIFRADRSGSRLRHLGGYYYLNELAKPDSTAPAGWHTRRLWLHGGQLRLATFTDDTLRLAVLQEAGLLRKVQADNGWPHYLVSVTSQKQSRALLQYEGLWEEKAPTYVRR